jgi:hypothetical protein
MPEDKVEARELSWRHLLPWTEIFRGFGVALDLNKLLLAAAGIFVMWIGWFLLAWIFGATYANQPPQVGTFTRETNPWAAFQRERNHWNLMHATAGVGNEFEKFDVEDLAESAEENERVRKVVGDGPDYPESKLEALGQLQPPLDPDKVRLYRARLGKTKPYGRLSYSPWSENRGPNPYLLVTGRAGIPWEPGHAFEWFAKEQFPVLIEPLIKLVLPVVYFLSPDADNLWLKLYFLLVFVWTVLTWAMFGGAITRIAVVQVARPGEPIGLTEAVRFTYKRLLSYVAAPLFPLALIFVLLIFSFIFSLFHMIPIVGDIFVDGMLWFVMLLIGLVMTLSLVGLAVGWPLMAPTISAEGTDSWEALSRSFSYVFQRPWHYLWYATVTIAYGAVVIFFVGLMGSLTVYLSKWAVTQTTFVPSRQPSFLFVYAPQSFGWRSLLLQGTIDDYPPKGSDARNDDDQVADPKATDAPIVQNGDISIKPYTHYVHTLTWYNKVGAALVAFWLGLLFLLILGFGYSFFFSATTIIYLLMRRNLDAAEMDEVYLEEDDQDGFSSPISAAAPESIKATPPLQMVEAPSLRPVTPPMPVPPPATMLAPTPAPAPAQPTHLADTAVLPPHPPAPPTEPAKDGADKPSVPPV